MSFRNLVPVIVRRDNDGHPAQLEMKYRTWIIAPGPLRWYERVNWWETSTRMQPGNIPRIDREVWRVQARLGHNPKNELRTIDLIHDRDGGGWFLKEETETTP